MAKYQFLTEEWIEAAKKIRDEHAGSNTTPVPEMRMNLVVTDVPFGDGTVNAHGDTSGGNMEMDLGHMDNAELTVTLDYDTAKALLVEQDPQAGMQAFMAGKVKVDGDIMKLMAMQNQMADPKAAEVGAAIKEITE